MKALVCIDKNRAIGFENRLLFSLPEDLGFYRKQTRGKTIVAGKKTLLSFPKGRPLPGRNNVILSSSIPECEEELKGGYVFAVRSTPERLLDYLDEKGLMDEAVLSGGEAIYRLFIDECDSLVITEVQTEAAEADSFFPEYKSRFHITQELGPYYEGELRYYRRTYKKNG